MSDCLWPRELASTKHQHESAIGLPMSPPIWKSFPPPFPSHPSRLFPSPGLNFLSHMASSHWLSILRMIIYASMLLSLYLPPSPSPSPPPSYIHKSALKVSASTAALCKSSLSFLFQTSSPNSPHIVQSKEFELIKNEFKYLKRAIKFIFNWKLEWDFIARLPLNSNLGIVGLRPTLIQNIAWN